MRPEFGAESENHSGTTAAVVLENFKEMIESMPS